MNELILKKQEFEQELVNIINNSQLPAFVVRPILNDLLTQVIVQEKQQLDKAVHEKEEEISKKQGADKKERNDKSKAI